MIQLRISNLVFYFCSVRHHNFLQTHEILRVTKQSVNSKAPPIKDIQVNSSCEKNCLSKWEWHLINLAWEVNELRVSLCRINGRHRAKINAVFICVTTSFLSFCCKAVVISQYINSAMHCVVSTNLISTKWGTVNYESLQTPLCNFVEKYLNLLMYICIFMWVCFSK